MKTLSLILAALSLLLLDSCTTGEHKLQRSSNGIASPANVADPTTEVRRSVRGRIKITSANGGTYVRIITSSGEEIDATWPGWSHQMNVNSSSHGTDSVSLHDQKILRDQAAAIIDSDQDYHIELLTENIANPTYLYYEILRVSKSNRILIDASICQIHKIKMHRQLEDVCSADSYPESFFKKQKREFPNDGNFYSACSQKSDPTWKCPQCSKFYDTWAKRHGLK